MGSVLLFNELCDRAGIWLFQICVTCLPGCAAWLSGSFLLEATLRWCCLWKRVKVSSLDSERKTKTVCSSRAWGVCGEGRRAWDGVWETRSSVFNIPPEGRMGGLARWVEPGLSLEQMIPWKEGQNQNQRTFLCSCMETEVKMNNIFFIFTLTSEMSLIIPDYYLLIAVILSHIDSFLEFTNILYLLSYLILATVLTGTLTSS